MRAVPLMLTLIQRHMPNASAIFLSSAASADAGRRRHAMLLYLLRRR
jgi:hypothetical protein